MGMSDFFKKLIPSEDEYEDEYYEEEQQTSFFEEEESERDISSSSARPQSKKVFDFGSRAEKKADAKVVSFNTSQIQVVLVKPTRFEDAPSIADHLNDRKTVVLNLEAANRETSRRLIDFLSGTAYATRGNIKKVANSTFIITPANVDVLGELIADDFDTDGMFLG